MLKRVGWLVILAALGSAAAAAAAQSATSARGTEAASRTADIPLALLSGPSPAADGEPDVVLGELAKALEATAGLKVLDRQHVRKLLAEHRLTAAAVVRQPVKRGHMLGAKYLLYLEVQHNASVRTLAMIAIEVSSGNVIWERAVSPNAKDDGEATGRWARAAADDLAAGLRASERRADRPTATVLSVVNRSRSGRLGFLESSLHGLLEDLLQSHGYRVLRRRHPRLLARETALGISGMVRPDTAVVAEAADLVVAAHFAETPSVDVPFDQTPIDLALTVTPAGGMAREHRFRFTLAAMSGLVARLQGEVSGLGQGGQRGDQEVRRRIEAARLMAELKDLPYTAPLEQHLKQVETARRVVYLDPTARDAYYHLGISLDAQSRGANDKKWSDQPDLYRDAAEAFERYLSFDPSDPERVAWAFRYLIFHLGVVNKDHPARSREAMLLDGERKGVWIIGGGFLARYADGKLHVSPAELPAFPAAAVADGRLLLLLLGSEPNDLIALDVAGQKTTTLLTEAQQRAGIPVPATFHAPPRGFNAGVYSRRRAVPAAGRIFLVTEYGLQEVDRDGKLLTTWRPDGFFCAGGLGGWVLGNCPLPPCGLKEVVADDRDEGLLWLVSKHDETIPPYHFLWAKAPPGTAVVSPRDKSQAFLTAFRPATGRFSRPIRVEGGFVHVEPRGESLYVTGARLARLPKKLWTADRPGQQDDRPPTIECPDTDLGRTSRAALLGNRDPNPSRGGR